MKQESTKYKNPSFLPYYMKWLRGFLFSKFVMNTTVIRNDLKKAKGPYIIISNHTSSYDSEYMALLTKHRLTFVMGDSIYHTLKFPWLTKQYRIVHKSEYRTTYHDIKKMKTVVDNGGRLILFPTGILTPSGKETILPLATGKFLKLMNVDVFVVNLHGTYLSKPKWSKKLRRGRVEIEAFKLISGDKLKEKSAEELYDMANKALSYNEYEWQENKLIKYKNGDNLLGLQNILYSCPICKAHKSISMKGKNTLYCKECRFEETSDEYGFLHNTKHPEQEIRHISDWADIIFNNFMDAIREDKNFRLQFSGKIEILNKPKHCFTPIGKAQIVLDKQYINLIGEDGKMLFHELAKTYPTIPFVTGQYFELHNYEDTYNFYPDDALDICMFVNAVSALFRL